MKQPKTDALPALKRASVEAQKEAVKQTVSDLSLLELRVLQRSLSGALYKLPHLKNLIALSKQIDKRLVADERYKKGNEYLKAAISHGLDDGYAAATDYYFSVKKENMVDYNNKETGDTCVTLLLCLKFNWWFNGEAYLPHEDGSECRNFHDFVTREMYDYYRENDQYRDADELRTQLIKAGMEEKPELFNFYRDLVDTEQMRNEERRKKR